MPVGTPARWALPPALHPAGVSRDTASPLLPDKGGRASLSSLPKEAASFVLQGEALILCSESMCSKDKPQENSCCLLTLTIRIVGKWRKQEMTNGFNDQEEMVAENCCLVTGHSLSALL